MSKELIADIFNRSSDRYDNAGVKFFSYFGNLLVEKLHPHKGAKVLDLGCGKGAVMIPAANAVGENGYVEGIDISIGMLNQLNLLLDEYYITNTRTLLMDAEDLGFPEHSFDYITGAFVLFFFIDPLQTLIKLKPLLSDHGKVCFSTFSDDNSLEWVMKLVLKYLPESDEKQNVQERFETEKSLKDIFNDAGYDDIRVVKQSHTFIYKDEKQWFEELLSHGYRSALENMTEENLELFRVEAFDALQTFKKDDGIHIPISVLFTFAQK